jgi:hypothetical protein
MGGVPTLAALASNKQMTAAITLNFMELLSLGHKKGAKRLIVRCRIDCFITYYIGMI